MHTAVSGYTNRDKHKLRNTEACYGSRMGRICSRMQALSSQIGRRRGLVQVESHDRIVSIYLSSEASSEHVPTASHYSAARKVSFGEHIGRREQSELLRMENCR